MTTAITVTYEDQHVEEATFDATTTRISVGRRPNNDVCITDRSVSGRHLVLERTDDSVWVQDLNSTNGTYVNGQRVDRCELQPGDSVQLGKVHLSCRAAAQSAEALAADALDRDHDDSFDSSFHDPDLVRADEDDELDESMKAALALYEDDVEPEPVSEPVVIEEDDDLDFSEDARLFAQRAEQQLAGEPEDTPVDDEEARPEEPLTLTDRAKVALGRQTDERPKLRAVNADEADRFAAAAEASEGPAASPDTAGAAARHDAVVSRPLASSGDNTGPTHELEPKHSRGAVIQIKNGAKSGQVLPIDKPVTTLGRPGIQIAAIMRKPDGYFLMHIESDDSVERPTLNADAIGDEPVLLHSGDELNVAGIDVEFMLS